MIPIAPSMQGPTKPSTIGHARSDTTNETGMDDEILLFFKVFFQKGSLRNEETCSRGPGPDGAAGGMVLRLVR